jgi:hypothetical protein
MFVCIGEILLLLLVVAMQLAAEDVALMHRHGGSADEQEVVHEVGQRRRGPGVPVAAAVWRWRGHGVTRRERVDLQRWHGTSAVQGRLYNFKGLWTSKKIRVR